MADTAPVPTIRDLIRSALDEGKSVRDLAADSGDRVKFQTFQELANHPPKQFPKDPKTIAGMAGALRVSETTVVLAYAKGLGIGISTDSGFALRLPVGIDTVDPRMQDALIAVARAAVKSDDVQGASGLERLKVEGEKLRVEQADQGHKKRG